MLIPEGSLLKLLYCGCVGIASGIDPALEIVTELVLELKPDFLRLKWSHSLMTRGTASVVPIVFLELIVLLLD